MSAIFSKDLQRQRDYVGQLTASGFQFSLVAASAFVRGMRDSGYKSTATALDELVDNAIQGQADEVDVVMGYAKDNDSRKKIDYLAVTDNGHGMDPDMIRVAVVWGGTHREGDRTGFGRYGFGLASASVSIAERFTVYSRVPGGDWHYVTVDLRDISAGKCTDKKTGATVAPKAIKGTPPEAILARPESVKHGTVVLLEQLDRLTPGFVTSAKFQEKMLEHLGLYYRGLLRSVRMRVVDPARPTGAKVVEPVDPLFLTPGARFYDESDVRAVALPETVFPVKGHDTGEAKGTVRIRYSYLPPGFQKNAKGRLNVMKENNGIIVMRAGRQVDVLTRVPFTTFVNYDRNWVVEIDFEPTLDEYFGVTTNKQQITISEAMWDILKERGLGSAITALRRRYKEDKSAEGAAADSGKKKASEEAMKEAEKYRTRKRPAQSPDREARAQKRLEEEINKRAKATGKRAEEIRADLEQADFKVVYESMPGAPFYRMEQVGGLRELRINTAHRFYSDVYNGPSTTPQVRSSLEALLFVLGECELSAREELQRFYERERGQWSTEMATLLDILDRNDAVEDAKSADDVLLEDEEAALSA